MACRGRGAVAGLGVLLIVAGLLLRPAGEVSGLPLPPGGGELAGGGLQSAPNAMAVDAVAGGGVDAGRTVSGTAPFDVSVHVTAAGQAYSGYGAVLEYDGALLSFVPASQFSVTYVNTDTHGLNLQAVGLDEAAGGSLRTVKMGAVGPTATAFVGEMVVVRFQCVADGAASLHLVPAAPPVANTSTLTSGGLLVATATADASVTCQGVGAPPTPGGPTPTPPAPGVTPAGTPGPTSTPLPTPLPGPREPVPLLAGCNLLSFVAYDPGTPLIAVVVDISGGNPRLWFQVAGTTSFDLFDFHSIERSTKTALGPGDEAGFICVDADATWNRPVL